MNSTSSRVLNIHGWTCLTVKNRFEMGLYFWDNFEFVIRRKKENLKKSWDDWDLNWKIFEEFSCFTWTERPLPSMKHAIYFSFKPLPPPLPLFIQNFTKKWSKHTTGRAYKSFKRFQTLFILELFTWEGHFCTWMIQYHDNYSELHNFSIKRSVVILDWTCFHQIWWF